jgi:hypothetical protein
MNDLIDDEQTPLDGGGVPLPNSSTREKGEISESDEELDADFIRNGTTVITTDLGARELPRAAPTRLTFSLPEARGKPNPEEDPMPRATRQLDKDEQLLGTMNPPATSNIENDAGQAAADLLRNSLGLTEEGSTLHGAIKSALGFHEARLKHNQRSIIPTVSASADARDARVTDALLRRLNDASISDGDDEDNDTPEITARKDFNRHRKTRRLIDKKKIDSEAKDSVTTPTEPLPANRRLSNHHDFLAVQIFLMDLEDMVVRKDWSSPIEMWVFQTSLKRVRRHTPPSPCFSSRAKGYSSTPTSSATFGILPTSVRLFYASSSQSSGIPSR